MLLVVEVRLSVPFPMLISIFLTVVVFFRMTEAHPFATCEEYDCLLNLSYLFGPDIDVVEINLSDSTNGKRIKLPGRGSRCDHVDVVDVQNSTHASRQGDMDWICPVCGVDYDNTDDIFVDGLLLGILGELNAEDPDGNVRAINLRVDGSWEHVSSDVNKRVPMARKKRNRLTLAQATAVKGMTLGEGEIVLSDSESNDASSKRKTNQQVEVVDLDSD
jgi:hypothetical protein